MRNTGRWIATLALAVSVGTAVVTLAAPGESAPPSGEPPVAVVAAAPESPSGELGPWTLGLLAAGVGGLLLLSHQRLV